MSGSEIEFIWREADMLDRGAYDEWLGLWAPDGRYIVPVDFAATDFSATLNYAYDDRAMRELRVRRLTSGQSTSAAHAARTLRTVSRFVTAAADVAVREIRCAQMLVAHKREQTTIFAADLTYRLIPASDGFLIHSKIIRLVNAADDLKCIGFLL